MHCMALPFSKQLLLTNSYLTVPRSWLCKAARASEGNENELGKLSARSIYYGNTFVLDDLKLNE